MKPANELEVSRSASTAVVVLLAALTAVLETSCGSTREHPVQAGAAAVDITPRAWPLPLIGSFRYRSATSAHDPLFARAIALGSGSSTVAIALVDSCYIPRETIDEAKRIVGQATGLESSRLLIAATHTHSAPPPAAGAGLRGLESEKHDQNERLYAALLVRGIADSIIESVAKMEPAEVGWASGTLPDEVFNRRWLMKDGSIPPDPFGGRTDRVRMNPPFASPNLLAPSGPVDPEVAVLSVRSVSRDPIALLANYSLHYVGGIPAGQVSADYFGEFARIVEERLGSGKGFVGILSNGTSANINNHDFSKPRPRKKPFEQVRQVAAKLADVALEAHARIEYSAEPGIEMAQSELMLARRKPAQEVLARSRALLADPPQSLSVREMIYAQRAVDLHTGPDRISVLLQALRIGGLGIVSLPFETFVETGLSIKRLSPIQPTFVIELANGAEGYLPTPEHHELGGYETWLGTSRVELRASVKIENQLLSLLEEVSPPPK